MKALVILLALAGNAAAYAPCFTPGGWSAPAGTKLPVQPRIAYTVGGKWFKFHRMKTIDATIDGVSVPTKLTWVEAETFLIALIDIDSKKTGKLVVAWPNDPATFQITTARLPAKTRGVLGRVDQADFRGLEIALDTPATTMSVKWRAIAGSATWQTVEIPVLAENGKSVGWLGKFKCGGTMDVVTLAAGIELKVTAVRSDGAIVDVDAPTKWQP